MIYRFLNCELNTDRVLLTRDGKVVRIEPQVFDVLALLASRRGRVVSRDELLNEVWGHEHVSESTLSSRIKMARRAVGDDGARQSVIRTVHGKGYEFVAALENAAAGDHETVSDSGHVAQARPSNLPAALHALIGREQLLNQVKVELHTYRLVTLIGPGGVGKTSLALELARSVEERYDDGVFAVELVTVLNPEATLEAIATALRVHTRQDDTLENSVMDFLHTRESLLLLDNCEHLVEPLSRIVDRILRTAPRVTIVTTSREPLAVAGERLWPVDPLPFADDSDEKQSVEQVKNIPAIRLFVERAVAVDPHFALTGSNAPAVMEICRRLDGMPLAIELAAARARSIDVSQISRRLDQRFRLLKGVRRGSDTRHQTLHDTVSWSFELLSPKEQKLFSELSVFAGQFDLEAAESICESEPESDVIDLVTRLVERSMVSIKRSESFGLRYELLDSLRAYGREQLQPAHGTALSGRHARYYIGLANTVEHGLQTDSEPRFAKNAEGAFPDLRAVLRFCIDAKDSAGALSLICAVREYAMRSMRYEALTWADAAVRVEGAETHPLFPTAMAIRGYAAWVRGEFETALDLARRAAELEARLNIPPSGLVERVLGNVLYVQGDTSGGFAATSRQLVLAEESRNHSRLTHACYMQSIASSSLGDAENAAKLAERARHYSRKTANPTDIASAFTATGFSIIDDSNAALDAFSQADRVAVHAGNRWMSNFARTEICGLLVEKNELDRARASLAEVIDVWFGAGECAQQWLTLTRCVIALFAIEEYELGGRVIGAIEARSVLGALPVSMRLRDQALGIADLLRGRFGSERYEMLLEEGAQLPISEVVHAVRGALLGQSTR